MAGELRAHHGQMDGAHDRRGVKDAAHHGESCSDQGPPLLRNRCDWFLGDGSCHGKIAFVNQDVDSMGTTPILRQAA